MSDDDSVVIRVEVDVRVQPDQMLPYPTIEKLPALERAMRLVEECCTKDIRWVDGVEKIEHVRSSVVIYANITDTALNILTQHVQIIGGGGEASDWPSSVKKIAPKTFTITAGTQKASAQCPTPTKKTRRSTTKKKSR